MLKNRTVVAQFAAPFAIILLGGLISAYLVMSRPQARPNPIEEKIRSVRVVNARIENIRPDLLVYGEITAGREAEIRAMVAGRIVSIDPNYRTGAYVTAGQQFIEIDPFDYEVSVREQQANLDEARAKLAEIGAEIDAVRRFLELLDEQIELRERDRDRSGDLIKRNQTSEKAFDDAKLAVNVARQQRVQAQQSQSILLAKLDQQNAAIARTQAQLDRARRELADTEVNAPFAGYLQDIVVATGKRVAVGESLGRLIDADGLEVRFEIPNADYARLIGSRSDAAWAAASHPLAGTEVRVQWRLGEIAYTYHGRIERSGAEVDSTGGGVTLYARITSGPIGILRPGVFVEVTVPDVAYDDVIMLPETAVSDHKILYYVVDSRLVAREVEVVRKFEDKVLVRGDIAPDSAIVAEQFPAIGPGLRVQSD